MSVADHFIPHFVFLPSGVGNLTPFSRLALMMESCNCKVTFIKIHFQAPCPEFTSFSSLIADHPRVEVLDFEMHLNNPADSMIYDPFITRVKNINSSLHQLIPLLSSFPISAIVSDFAIAAIVAQISEGLNIPLYLVSTTSAKFFSLVANLPVLLSEDSNMFSNSSGEIKIPGLTPIPKSSIPPTWMHEFSTNNLLKEYLLPNAESLSKAKGVFLNTFVWFEQETISAHNSSRVTTRLPPVYPIGPLQSYEPQKMDHLSWLNTQPDESVVYVDFGSRAVMSIDQIRELGRGLEICGYSYLWVITGDVYQEGTNSKGKIIRGFVDQESVLAHSAIGGFVNHCEWDSVMQAARNGVPLLAWPLHGDQKMNAEIVEEKGLGIWIKEWSSRSEKLVEGDEIGHGVTQIMGDLNIKQKAKTVQEKAREACEIGGSSKEAFMEVIQMSTSNKK